MGFSAYEITDPATRQMPTPEGAAIGPDLPSLVLHCAAGFLERLLGVWARPVLEHQGLWLRPCRAIHTFGLSGPLDVLFLDAQGKILRQFVYVKPNRVLWERSAHSVIELPGGYCMRHPCYARVLQESLGVAIAARRQSTFSWRR